MEPTNRFKLPTRPISLPSASPAVPEEKEEVKSTTASTAESPISSGLSVFGIILTVSVIFTLLYTMAYLVGKTGLMGIPNLFADPELGPLAIGISLIGACLVMIDKKTGKTGWSLPRSLLILLAVMFVVSFSFKAVYGPEWSFKDWMKSSVDKVLSSTETRRNKPPYVQSEVQIYYPGTYTFSLKAGEVTDHWIMFPDEGEDSHYTLVSKDYKYKVQFDDGTLFNCWEISRFPTRTRTKFKIIAVTDQQVVMTVKK